MTTSTPHRHIKKRLIKTVGAHTPCSCGYIQGGDLYFYIKDYQGNVRVVLNQANQPVEVNSYYPYGGLMASTTTEGTQPYKYSTKELDRENGLDLYDSKTRMYDPTIGRTPTQDPMAEKYYSKSPYLWCAANPITFTDPTGAIVQIDSTKMTSEQYQCLLEDIKFMRKSDTFNRIYTMLESNTEYTVTITFGKTILNNGEDGVSEPVFVQYSADTKTITIENESSPTILQLSEEFYHAMQDMFGVLTNGKNNVEFEAKNIALIVAGESNAPYVDYDNGIPKSYKEFLYYSSLEMSASLKAYIQNNYISNGRFFSQYWKRRKNNHYSTPVNSIPNLLKHFLK